MALPQNTYTLESFIEAGRSITLTYPSTSFMNQTSNGTWVGVWNVVNDYMPELKEAAVTVKLSENEMRRYRFRPKLLCHDIYGNAELYFVILLINNMIDVKEFNISTLKMISKGDMSTLMSAIYNAEKKSIDAYNNKDEHL